MWKLFRGKKGFTLVEVMFVAVIGFVIIASILSVWVFACRTWTGETERTNLRIGMVKALETIKNDLRLSSVPHISYYPAGAEKYTAFSIPVASLDANGFFTLNATGTIDWDKTVIYHLFPAGGSKYTLRRTVFDPRDNTMTSAQRYTQLANVVSAGDGSSLGGSTDMEFLENVDLFTISSLAPSVDFYDPSSYAVKENQVMFGWVKLGSGSHTIRLEITGKNSLSSGYDLGVDNIRIEPCGSVREVECANSGVFPGVFNVSGGTANNIFGSFWNNNGFVELTGAGVGSYMEITDSYDLWRESAFNGVSFNNTERVEDEFRIGLDVPEDQEQGATAWFVAGAIGDPVQEGTSGFVNPVNPAVAPSQPIVVRTLIDNSHVTIDPDVPGDQVDMIRVNFKTATFGNLKIDKAYITRKSNSATAQSYDGVANDDPTSKTIQEYHCHQQLFFKDTIADFDNDGNTNDIVEGVIISPSAPQKGEAWSEWTAFPLIVREPAGMGAVDYFITFYVSDLTQAACSYWQGGATNSYYLTSPGIGNAAGTPVWGGVYTPAMSNDVFAVVSIDTWKKTGSVESQIFDTSLSAPSYNQITWFFNQPAGTYIGVKARSSASSDMVGATNWDSIASFTASPGALAIGNGRYVQFYANLSAEPFWETPTNTLSYANYISAQRLLNPYQFPMVGGDPYVMSINSPLMDDVTITWPGSDRVCAITADIAKKNDYGQAKITVDGIDLDRVLTVHVSVSNDVGGRTISEDNYVEIDPRNTGK